MADNKKPYPVALALADGHSPDTIGQYLRGEGAGRPVDSTGVAPNIMRRILAPVPSIPADRMPSSPFGVGQPPIAPETGVQRPQYQPPASARGMGSESVSADATRTVPTLPHMPAERTDPFGWMPPAGMIGGGLLSLLTGPNAPVSAIPLSGWGGALGKGASQLANRVANTGFAPQSPQEAIRGMSAAGLEGMATEALGQPMGRALGAGSKWLGNRIVRGGVGVGDEAAQAMARLNVPATKAGARRLETHLGNMNSALNRAVAEEDRLAGGPSVSSIDVLAPVRDLWFKQAQSDVVSREPQHRFAQAWLTGAGKLGNKKLTYSELLEIKRTADKALNYNRKAQAGRAAQQFILSSEEEQAYKAVADNARNILNGLGNAKVPVPGISKGMTIGEINALQSSAIDAQLGIEATLQRPLSNKALPLMMGAGTFYGSHDPVKALGSYIATSAATDPAINSTVALMLQNPAFLRGLAGAPQNAARAGMGFMGGTGTK